MQQEEEEEAVQFCLARLIHACGMDTIEAFHV
jgi:hypothetical protein